MYIHKKKYIYIYIQSGRREPGQAIRFELSDWTEVVGEPPKKRRPRNPQCYVTSSNVIILHHVI